MGRTELEKMNELRRVHARLRACRDCPAMMGTPVHGPAVRSPVFLLGQAPGPREAGLGRPFAYTAGRTLFRWFAEATGVDEETFRARIYMAAVARCFPGKAAGGGDRVPDAGEIARCGRHLRDELAILRPRLILAVGKLAILQALGEQAGKDPRLTDWVGRSVSTSYHGHAVEVIALPHPSGLSAWPKVEPGKTLLQRALRLVARHPAWIEAVG